MYQLLNSVALKLFPTWLYDHLIGNWNKDGFKKYFANTGWLFFGKIVSFSVSFFMIAIVARYLGPENLGKLSYAQSFVAIFSVFASLGIDNLLFRDLVAHPEKENELLGTAFVIKFFFGALTTIVTAASAYFINTDKILTLLILLLSLSFIISPLSIGSTLFSARVKSKYTALSQITISILIPSAKLLIIFLGKGIIFFAGVIVFEAIVSVFLSLFFYIKVFRHSPLSWKFNKTIASTLIKNSLPLLLAGASGYVFSRIDQVMIQQLLGSISVGYYYGAVQITELMVGFIPGIIVGSLAPALINAKNISSQMYYSRLRGLITLALSVSVAIIIPIYFLAPFIVRTLYGIEFSASVPILHIYVWSTALYIMIMILQQHLINHNYTKIYLFLSLSTAVVNVILNWLLIPSFGTVGAAWATIGSLAIYLLLPICIPTLRHDYLSIIFKSSKDKLTAT